MPPWGCPSQMTSRLLRSGQDPCLRCTAAGTSRPFGPRAMPRTSDPRRSVHRVLPCALAPGERSGVGDARPRVGSLGTEVSHSSRSVRPRRAIPSAFPCHPKRHRGVSSGEETARCVRQDTRSACGTDRRSDHALRKDRPGRRPVPARYAVTGKTRPARPPVWHVTCLLPRRVSRTPHRNLLSSVPGRLVRRGRWGRTADRKGDR